MKKVFISVLSALLVSCITSESFGESVTVTLPGGSAATIEILSQTDLLARAQVTLASPSKVRSTTVADIAPGEFVEYYLETVARSSVIDLYSQCPQTTPNVSLGTIRFGWIRDRGIRFSLLPTDSSPVFYECTGGVCLPVNEDLLADAPLTLVSGGDNGVEVGLCLLGNPERSDPSDAVSSSDELPPPLDDSTCASEFTKACIEPLIVNSIILTTADSGVEATSRAVTKELQRKRRLLTRALKSNGFQSVTQASSTVRKYVRSLLVKGSNYASQGDSSSQIMLRQVVRVLGSKSKNPRAAAKRAVQLLRGLESIAS